MSWGIVMLGFRGFGVLGFCAFLDFWEVWGARVSGVGETDPPSAWYVNCPLWWVVCLQCIWIVGLPRSGSANGTSVARSNIGKTCMNSVDTVYVLTLIFALYTYSQECKESPSITYRH